MSEHIDFTDIEITQEELDRNEALWIEGASESKAEAEAEWRKQGKVFAVLDDQPEYVGPNNWDIYAGVPNPPAPCDRIIRFDLIGGGQIKSIEHFVPFTDFGANEVTCNEHDLAVTAHCGDTIKRGRGKFEFTNTRGPAEINHHAVLFNRGTDQEVVDRVAATFRAIGEPAGKYTFYAKDNFFALMSGASGCAICGRPLRDEISKLIGVGPTCAEQLHIPHSKAAAEKRLELRRKLLGA